MLVVHGTVCGVCCAVSVSHSVSRISLARQFVTHNRRLNIVSQFCSLVLSCDTSLIPRLGEVIYSAFSIFNRLTIKQVLATKVVFSTGFLAIPWKSRSFSLQFEGFRPLGPRIGIDSARRRIRIPTSSDGKTRNKRSIAV